MEKHFLSFFLSFFLVLVFFFHGSCNAFYGVGSILLFLKSLFFPVPHAFKLTLVFARCHGYANYFGKERLISSPSRQKKKLDKGSIFVL